MRGTNFDEFPAVLQLEAGYRSSKERLEAMVTNAKKLKKGMENLHDKCGHYDAPKTERMRRIYDDWIVLMFVFGKDRDKNKEELRYLKEAYKADIAAVIIVVNYDSVRGKNGLSSLMPIYNSVTFLEHWKVLPCGNQLADPMRVFFQSVMNV